MEIDLEPFERVEELKSLVREKLSLPANVALDLATDRLHALNDLTRGIADLNPHKRSIVTLGTLPPPLRDVAKGFAKLGYVVQEIKVNLRYPTTAENYAEQMNEQINALKKDTLFVLGCEIEPITGLFYPWKSVTELLLKKNIFLVNYFSPASLHAGLRLPTNGLEAFVIDPLIGGNSFVLKGERVVTESLLWGENFFTESDLLTACAELHTDVISVHQNESAILAFESEVKVGISKDGKSAGADSSLIEILPRQCERLFDRAVFFVKGVNGDALVNELTNHLGVGSSTTSDSVFWHDPHLNTWLPSLGFNLDDARTCIALSFAVTQNPHAGEVLLTAIAKLQKISGTI